MEVDLLSSYAGDWPITSFATGKSRDVADNSAGISYWLILILIRNPNSQLNMIFSRENGADKPCLCHW